MPGFLLSRFQARETVNIHNMPFLRSLDGNPDKNLPVSITVHEVIAAMISDLLWTKQLDINKEKHHHN